MYVDEKKTLAVLLMKEGNLKINDYQIKNISLRLEISCLEMKVTILKLKPIKFH